MDKLLGRKQRPESKPPDCLARYNCVKHSWRGRLRRVFCIALTAIHTQNPDRTLVLTNSYTFVDDSDIESVSIGSDEYEFTISARQDKRSKFKPIKFTCKHRALLLTDLFQCMSAAAGLGRCVVAAKILGSPQVVVGSRWCPLTGSWQPIKLRLTATSLEELGEAAGAGVMWRCDLVHLASPGIALLLPSPATTATNSTTPPAAAAAPALGRGPAAAAAAGGGVEVLEGVFAVLPGPAGGGGRGHPRVYSCRQREVLLKALTTEGKARLGVTITVESCAQLTAQQLLLQWQASQESGAANSTTTTTSYASAADGHPPTTTSPGSAAALARGDAPLGQWEMEALVPRADIVPGQLAAAGPQVSGRRWTLEQLAAAPLLNVPAGGNLVATRLVVTPSHLLERSVTSHALERRTPLASIAALVRFAHDPKLLAVEWEGGGPPSTYVTAARDAVLALLLDAAQVAAGRPIAVLPGFTFPGDVVVTDHKHPSHAPATELDPDLLALYLRDLGQRGRDLGPAVAAAGATSGSGGGSSTGLTVLSATSALLSSSPSFLDGPPTPPGRPPSSNASTSSNPFSTAATGPRGAAATSSLESVTPGEAAALLLEVVYEFNACVPYAGVPPGQVEGVDGAVLLALTGLLPQYVSTSASLTPDDVKQVVAVLQCMQRLASHPALADQLLSTPGLMTKLWTLAAAGIGAGAAKAAATATAKAGSSGSSGSGGSSSGVDGVLGGGDDHVTAEVARLLLRLWAPAAARRGAAPWKVGRGVGVAASTAAAVAQAAAATAADELAAAAAEDGATARSAKLLCFPPNVMGQRLGVLLGPLGVHPPVSPLTSMCLLEAVAALAVEPGARNSDPALASTTLEVAAGLGRPLFALFSHPAPRVGDGLAVVMRGVAGCGPGVAAPMRDAALREGALLHHLNQALFATGARAALSQQLVAAWSDGYAPALTLLRRILPPGLVRYLNVPQTLPAAPPSPPPEPTLPTTPTSAPPPNTTTSAPAAAAQAAMRSAQAAAASAAATVTTSFNWAVGGVSAAIAAASGSVMQEGSNSTAVTPLAASLMQQSQQQQQQQEQGAAGNCAAAVSPGEGAGAGVPAAGSAPAAAEAPSTAAGGSNPAAAPPAPAAGASAVAPAAAAAADQGAATSPAAAAPAADGAGVAPPAAPAVAAAPAPARPPLSTGLKGNWGALWEAAGRDHCHASLIWNAATRGEAREALGREEASLRGARLRVAQGAGSWPSWNWSEFSVEYPSLSSQLCIAGVYIRLLLEGPDPAAIDKVAAPKDLFTACYHTLLCCLTEATTGSSSSSRAASSQQQGAAALHAKQLLCVQAMAAAYNAHAGVIGPFDGMQHLLQLMDQTQLRSLRHALLLLLQALLMPRAAGPPAAAAALAAAFATSVTGRGGNITTLPKLAAAGGQPVAGQTTAGQILTSQQLAAVRAANANGYALLDAGGLELLVDVVAGAHECSERRAAAVAAGGVAAVGAGHLLTSISHDQVPKEWYHYPHGYQPEGAAAATTPQASPPLTPAPDAPSSNPVDEAGRAGPITKDELKQLVSRGVITPTTHCWAAGMPQPRQLKDLRELRWLAATGPGLLGPFDAALLALQLLQQLAAMQPAVDEQGCVVTPLPRVHRELAAPGALPHLVQVLLTGEPALVAACCQLLVLVLAHHPAALSRLYLTGAFFFGLAYCGSNLEELAMLFKVAHLVQAHRGPAELSAGLPLAQRSYLGDLLPESLLYMLDSYGPRVFAAALGGDHDTPELLWTHAMRMGRLVPALLQHLGDFPHRLAQHCHAVYDFTPCAPLTWPELGSEVWCHRYYLRALTDEVRFRDWPVVEHLPLLQALMEQWRAELARQPLSMSESAACEALGLTPGPGGAVAEEDMRRAYRQAARRYHPDKNPDPAARTKFLVIQKAYQRLLAGAAGGQGPQAWRLLLMLRAQVILYRRYSSVLTPFKYAGYPQLLEVLRQQAPEGAATPSTTTTANGPTPPPPPAAAGTAAATPSPTTSTTATGNATSSGEGAGGAVAGGGEESGGGGGGGGVHFLSPDRVDLVLAAVELCWLTCAASHRNAEELLRAGGVATLGGLLSRCVAVMPLDVAPTAQPAVLTTHLLRSCAGMAAVEGGRRQLAEHPALIEDIIRCCSLERAPAAVDAALLALCHLAASGPCQALLLDKGVLPHVVPLLLSYDPTLSSEAAAALVAPFTPGRHAVGVAAAAAGGGKEGGGQGQDSGDEGGVGVEGLVLLGSPLVRVSQPEARSQHALLAARALARLAGLLPAPYNTPANETARTALSALLTSSLAGRLGASDLSGLLGPLSSSLETAQVIWNSSMREELLKVLAQQRAAGAHLPSLLSFSFSSLAGELQVGGVFIRVFNARAAPGGSAAASAATVTTTLQGPTAAAGAGGQAAAGPAGALGAIVRHPSGGKSGGSTAGSGAPADPPGFAKALVRFLYERLVERCFRGTKLQQLSPRERQECLEVLTALTRLLGQEPRLLGLLASKSAVGAVVAAVAPAACSWPPLMQQAQQTGGAAAAAGLGQGDGAGPVARSSSSSGTPGDQSGSAQALNHQDQQQQQQAEEGGSRGSAGGSSVAGDSPQQLAADADRLAASALSLLLAASQSAPVLEAMVDEPFLRQLIWLLYSPPSHTVLELALSLLKSVAATATAAVVAGYQGGAVLLLSVLLHQGPWPWGQAPSPEAEGRVVGAAADVLGRVMGQAGHGPRVVLLLGQLLPPGLVAALEEGPEEAVVRALHTAVETPECLWDSQMSSQAAAEVATLAAAIRTQHAAGKWEWALPQGYTLRYAKLAGEVYVGGVYVRLFMKNPRYALRDPKRFSEALMDRFLVELQGAAAAGGSGGGTAAAAAAADNNLLLLSAAAVALLQGHLLLADHLAQLGVASRLLVSLAGRTAGVPPAVASGEPVVVVAPDEVGGAILRLLHQLAASPVAAEALASASSAPLVPTVTKAMAWGHGATLLVLELLKRALQVGNRQRDVLVAQALSCQLPQTLLKMLDWRQSEDGGTAGGGGGGGQEAQVQRALAVDVLMLLSEEGVYGGQVAALLATSEVWSAYRHQRHDMFLPSGATADSGVVGLLTAGDTARYALPPTEEASGAGAGRAS